MFGAACSEKDCGQDEELDEAKSGVFGLSACISGTGYGGEFLGFFDHGAGGNLQTC
jgi:hypothetical protein